MIGLDTNVLVRYLAQDDPVQSAGARAFIEQELTEEVPGFISIVALVETVWVLERAYKLPRPEIAATVEAILRTTELTVEHEQAAFTAMLALKDGSGAFADTLIGALGAAAGCSHTVTFDRKASRLPGFKVI